MELTAVTTAQRTVENLNLAIKKAKQLTNYCQIRLTADHNSYVIINVYGMIFIGVPADEDTPKFFSNRETYTMTGPDGTPELKHLQRLFKNPKF
jgi:hypothetical protein